MTWLKRFRGKQRRTVHYGKMAARARQSFKVTAKNAASSETARKSESGNEPEPASHDRAERVRPASAARETVFSDEKIGVN